MIDENQANRDRGADESGCCTRRNGLHGGASCAGQARRFSGQTRNTLDRIDALLAEAGSSKSKLLTASIWLADMDDFAEMNTVWDAWVAAGNTPCRACVESTLASPDFAVEIQVTAAL